MNELMNKVFKFGMYGKPITHLSEFEVNDLKDSNWVEFYDEHEIIEIENNVEFVPTRKTDICEQLYVRMGFSYFKRYLSDARFKEVSSFKIFNHLLISNDYVKQADLQYVGNVDTKKVSYVLKILRKVDLIKQKIIKNVSYVKLDIDRLFNKSKKQFPLPVIPISYSLEVPVYHAIKKRLLKSEVGLTSGDIRSEYGLSIKRSHNYLKRLETECSKQIATKQVFDGKTRKNLFYRRDKSLVVEDDLKEKGLITVEDRISALKQLLIDRKWISTCDKTFIKFKEILGSKYMPDRKTMISTAIKANLKVFNIRGAHSTSPFIIANDDVQLKDIILNRPKTLPKDNEFSRLVMSKYVKNTVLVSIDNLYEIKVSRRSEIVCKCLYDNFKHDCVYFTEDFLMMRPLSFLFSTVPFYKVEFVKKLLEELHKLQDEKTNFCLDKNTILDKYTITEVLDLSISMCLKKEINDRLKDKRLLRSIFEPYWIGAMDIFIKTSSFDNVRNKAMGDFDYNCTIVIHNDNFTKFRPKNKQDLNTVFAELKTNDLSLRLLETYQESIMKRKTLEKPILYVPYDERVKLYYSALDVNSRDELDNLITRHIQLNKYVSRHELIKFCTNNFECVIDEIKFINENSKEYLFTKIKYDLYIKNNVNPIDYNDYSTSSLREVLNLLNKTKYAKSNYRTITLENVQGREEIRKRLDRNLTLSIPNIESFQERDSIYSMYFNIIFDVLMFSGTLKMDDLLSKCNVLEDFELLNFITVYEDVFEIEEIDDVKLISIKLNINPFDMDDQNTNTIMDDQNTNEIIND